MGDAERISNIQSNQIDFIGWDIDKGWDIDDGIPVSTTCDDGNQFSISGSFARCCFDTDDCPMRTDCDGTSTLLEVGGGSIECPDGKTCHTISVLPSYYGTTALDEEEEVTWHIGCYSERTNTIYRAIAETALSSEPSSSSKNGFTSELSDSTSGTVPRTTANVEPTDTAGPGDPERASSKAWIAGPVLGPIALLVVIGFIVFWAVRRSRKRAEAEPPTIDSSSKHVSSQPYVAEVHREKYSSSKPTYAGPLN